MMRFGIHFFTSNNQVSNKIDSIDEWDMLVFNSAKKLNLQ